MRSTVETGGPDRPAVADRWARRFPDWPAHVGSVIWSVLLLLLAWNSSRRVHDPAESATHREDWLIVAVAVVWVGGVGALQGGAFLARRRRDEREAAYRTLSEREARYRSVIETSPDGFWLVDHEGRLREVNEVYAQLSGYTREELLNLRINDLDALETTTETAARIARLQREGRGIFETVHRAKDGTRWPVEARVTYIPGADGGGTMASFFRDLTASRRAENLARLQSDLGLVMSSNADLESVLRLALQTAIEAAGMDCGGLYLVDFHTGDLHLITHAGVSAEFAASVAKRAAGLPRTARVREGVSVFTQFRELAEAGSVVQEREGLKAIALVPLRHESQVIGCLNVASHSLEEVPGWARAHLENVAPQVANVVARGKTEQALQRHQALLEAIYEHAPFMLCLLNERGEVERMNRSMANLVAAPPTGRVPPSVCWALGCPNTQAPESRGPDHCATPCTACTLRPLIRESFETGQGRRQIELTVPHLRNGQRHEHRFMASTALVPIEGRARLLLCLEDISERKRLEAQFLQAQKMEAIGQLAGGVAHDFNNILGATLLHLELLLTSPGLDPGMRADLEELEKANRRAAALTRQLLLFGRREIAQVRRVNLAEVLRGLLKMLHRLLGEHIEVCGNFPDAEFWAEADPGMIEQVVMNLCLNARDAMPKGGLLRLELSAIEVSPARAQLSPDARVGSFVCLRVEDQGTGMDPETLKRIFEPFFTTKEAGRGTGLGLATVYGITRQHQGWIEVQSAVGLGTTFEVFFPAALSAPAPTEAPKRRQLPRGQETLLLVEDDTTLRHTTSRMLVLGGYQVLEAGNGAEALQIWQQHGHRVQLLLTDMVMPGGMSGLDLAEACLRTNPALKVIVASGYSPELPNSAGRIAPNILFLPKPYEPTTLAETLRRCLDAA